MRTCRQNHGAFLRVWSTPKCTNLEMKSSNENNYTLLNKRTVNCTVRLPYLCRFETDPYSKSELQELGGGRMKTRGIVGITF